MCNRGRSPKSISKCTALNNTSHHLNTNYNNEIIEDDTGHSGCHYHSCCSRQLSHPLQTSNVDSTSNINSSNQNKNNDEELSVRLNLSMRGSITQCVIVVDLQKSISKCTAL
jgi:hypothetical protein